MSLDPPRTLPQSALSVAGVPGPDATAIALIPLRTGGKSRLEGTLDEGRRAGLVLAMLDDVLAALHSAGLADIRVLAGDDAAAVAAGTRGLAALSDPSGPASPDRASAGSPLDVRLCRAVDAGLGRVGTVGQRLVVAADLPLLDAQDIRTLLDSPADVAVAPTSSGGTALLRLGAGVTIPSQYGPDSAAAHGRIARAQGLSVEMFDLPGAQRDIDRAADLDGLHLHGARPVGSSTASFLAI